MNDKSVYKLSSNMLSAVLGAILILLGILFLLGRLVSTFLDFNIAHFAWPFFIIIPGTLLFIASFLVERRVGVALAIAGGMATMTGSILFLQNIFDLYASWAYAWTLVTPTSIGLAKLMYGTLRGIGDEVRDGLRMAGIGAVMFVVGGFFFEVLIGINGFHFGLAWFCWPSLLIGLGAILLLLNLLPRRNSTSG